MPETTVKTERELWNDLAKERGWKYVDKAGQSYEQGWFHFVFLGTKFFLIFDRHGKVRFIESVKQSDVMTDREKFDGLFGILKVETTVLDQDDGHFLVIGGGYRLKFNKKNQYRFLEKTEM